MKKVTFFVFLIWLIGLTTLAFPSKTVFAQETSTWGISCQTLYPSVRVEHDFPNPVAFRSVINDVTFKIRGLNPNLQYKLVGFNKASVGTLTFFDTDSKQTDSGKLLTITVPGNKVTNLTAVTLAALVFSKDSYVVELEDNKGEKCTLLQTGLTSLNSLYQCEQFDIKQGDNVNCFVGGSATLTVKLSGYNKDSQDFILSSNYAPVKKITIDNLSIETTIQLMGENNVDTIELYKEFGVGIPICKREVAVRQYCEKDDVIVDPKQTLAQFALCDQVKATDKAKCLACITNTGGSASGSDQKITGLWTAIGCIPTSKEGIVTSLVRVGLGVSGGVIVLLVLAAAFMLATSAGDAKKVQEAQEMITSAVIGLLFVIFSVMIFRFIFTSILGLPGI